MMKSRMFRLSAVSVMMIGVLALSGCGNPTVSYTDPNAVNTTSINYSSTDLQTITSKMVDELTSSPLVARITANNNRPIIFIGGMKNNSDQQIDTKALTDAMSTRLIQSDKFQFVDMSQVDAVKAQYQYQQQSGMVDPQQAVAMGKQVGARYDLYGDIASINQRNSDQQSLYIQVTMKLLDIQTGLIVWQGEKQISKTATRKGFGW
jgi:uncharacterized protein (TIGR02722 family)